MDNDKLLDALQDPQVLIDAYAASSAYVMHKAFDSTSVLQAFKGRRDLSLAIRARIDKLIKTKVDPIIVSAHLYALELTGSEQDLNKATLHVLENSELRDDPLVGQFAGEIGFHLMHAEKELSPGAYLSMQDMDRVVQSLETREGL